MTVWINTSAGERILFERILVVNLGDFLSNGEKYTSLYVRLDPSWSSGTILNSSSSSCSLQVNSFDIYGTLWILFFLLKRWTNGAF